MNGSVQYREDIDKDEEKSVHRQHIPFKDVDEPLSRFYGEKNDSARRWISDFDDTMIRCNGQILGAYCMRSD